MTRHKLSWPKAVSTAAALLTGSFLLYGCSPAVAGYDLPPERAKYTFTLDRDNIHTSWEFWSSQVTEDQTPDGYVCAESNHALVMGEPIPPCRADPLIFLRYDANVGLDNSVPAPSVGQIKVTTYRQAPQAPPIAGLTLSVSTDGGRQWKPVKVTRHRGDVFVGVVKYPALADTTGVVALRAEAWDTGGNRVKQSLDQAYFLRAKRG
jgi:hypothetical protein